MVKRAHNFSEIPRLTVLIGKGGVGRSTMAGAMGMVAAGRGRRTLIIEVASRQVVPEYFNLHGQGYTPVQLADNLWTVRVTWEDALREYGLMKLKLKAAYRLVFENPFMRRLLPAIPGIGEILTIGKIVYTATDGVTGLGPMDAVILDGPATGHGMSLVMAPSIVAKTVSEGPMAEDARNLQERLADPTFSRFHIVTAPEEMPVVESIELYRRLGGPRGLPLGPMLVNQVFEHGLTAQELEALAAASGGLVPQEVCSEIQAARFMTDKFEVQRSHITKLRGQVSLPLLLLPDLRGTANLHRRISVLAEHLDSRLWREER